MKMIFPLSHLFSWKPLGNGQDSDPHRGIFTSNDTIPIKKRLTLELCTGHVVDIRVRLAELHLCMTTRDHVGEEGEEVLMLLAGLQVNQGSGTARGHCTHTKPGYRQHVKHDFQQMCGARTKLILMLGFALAPNYRLKNLFL